MPPHVLGFVMLAVGAMAVAVADADAQARVAAGLKPIEPVRAIIEAFESHDIIALDEGRHGNEQAHELRLKLIRHPSFARKVNDIVVEFGSALYQDMMDRYVRGEDVPADELRHAWQDTTQFAVWDVPIYEDFFRAVRQVNSKLAKDRQLRVLLADPPIDWGAVKTPPDHFKWLRARDTHGAELIQREVLAKKRKALLIFGGRHLQRKNISANYEPLDGAETVISILHDAGAAKIFTIWTATNPEPQSLQADMAGWPVPSLALLRGTRLGMMDFAAFMPPEARFDRERQAVAFAARSIPRDAHAGSVRRAALRRAAVDDHYREAPHNALRGRRISTDAPRPDADPQPEGPGRSVRSRLRRQPIREMTTPARLKLV
jgi:hypothetical protein